MRKILNGGYYPWAPDNCSGYVDVDDVAAAHTLSMLIPAASGRSVGPSLCRQLQHVGKSVSNSVTMDLTSL